MNNKKVYPPHERDYLEQKARLIKSYSEKDYTVLPDPTRDPIVCNNISNVEFDYTSKDLEKE